MTEELIRELVEIVRNTAPELWRIAVRQVAVNGIKEVLFTIVWFVVLFYAYRGIKPTVAKYKEAEDSYNMDEMILGVLIILLAVIVPIAAVLGMNSLSNAVSYLANPEYYAIKVLFDLVKP